MVGVGQEARVHLGHPPEQPLLVTGQGIPGPNGVGLGPAFPAIACRVDVGVDRRQLGLAGDNPHPLLALEHQLPVRLVAHVELAPVLVDPLLRGVVRGMARARAEVEEERFVRGDRLGVADELQRLVGEVGGEVVALRRRRRLLHRMVVVDQVRIPLVGLGAEEAVEPLEAPADRPLRLPRGHVHLVLGGQVPLAGHVRVPAAFPQHLRDRGTFERDVPVGARESRRGLGDRGHPVGGVIPAGHQARPRR